MLDVMISRLFFSGGSDYVQIFDQVDLCRSMDMFTMGDDRTRLLRDQSTSTCMLTFEDHQKNKRLLKLLPGRDYLFKRHTILYVASKRFSCSPINGIKVFIQPWCVDQANCPMALPCVSLKANQMDDLTVCKFRCQTQESWAYVYVEVEVGIDQELCEIWFSNVW